MLILLSFATRLSQIRTVALGKSIILLQLTVGIYVHSYMACKRTGIWFMRFVLFGNGLSSVR